MLTQLTTHATELAVLAGRGGGGINTGGITNWMAQTIIPIILAVIGLIIMAGARKGRFSEVFGTVAIVIVGLVMFLGAGAFVAFGDNIVGVIFR